MLSRNEIWASLKASITCFNRNEKSIQQHYQFSIEVLSWAKCNEVGRKHQNHLFSFSLCIIIHNFLWTSIIYLSTFWLKYHHEITKKQQYPKILRNSIFLHVSSGPYSNYSTSFIYTYTFIWYFVSVIE